MLFLFHVTTEEKGDVVIMVITNLYSTSSSEALLTQWNHDRTSWSLSVCAKSGRMAEGCVDGLGKLLPCVSVNRFLGFLMMLME